MKHLSSFKLFESSDAEIEMFEDMLQEYFDQYKIYPKDEVDSQGMYGSTTPNSDYEIKRVSTYFFKVPGFPNHAKGIHIKVHLWRHDALREDIAKGLTKFIYRIKKMGYETDAAYDDTFGVNFYISILDKKVEESLRYLNKNFEVSEDDFLNWTYEHELDKEGFSKREEDDIDRWTTNGFERKQHRFHHNKKAEVVANKSIAELYDGYEKIDICKYVDEWFTLFIEDKYENPLYYIFDNWEDLKERVDSHFNNYFNYYDQEDDEVQGEFESVTYVVDTDKIEKISIDEYKDLTTKWKKIGLSDFEMKKLEKIFKVWSVRKEIEYNFKNGQLYLEFGGRIFGKEVVVEKYEDDWYVINIIPRDAYNFASRNNKPYESYRQYYTCDQFDGVLELMKELDDKYTSNQDKTLFESKSTNQELCKELTDAEIEDFIERYSNEEMTEDEREKITEILSVTYDEVEIQESGGQHGWCSQEWYFDDKKIFVGKFQDSYFIVREEWINSWNKDAKVYLCDELDSIKYIDFYA